MTTILTEVLTLFDAGKRVIVHIQFGTVQGLFQVEKIEQKDEASNWIFHGENFQLSTGRYNFNRKEEENGVVRYIFSPKLENHPKKLICFEIK